MSSGNKLAIFRVDSGEQIGYGHLSRCLTLASCLRERDVSSHFVCRLHAGNASKSVVEAGHGLTVLPVRPSGEWEPTAGIEAWIGESLSADALATLEVCRQQSADYVIVDHYGLDHRWESTLRLGNLKVVVIDDLANRPHECEILVDQNLGRSRADYAGLVSEEAVVLAGPKFAMLRPEFGRLRSARARAFRLGWPMQILISMGGALARQLTEKTLMALDLLATAQQMTVVAVVGRDPQALASAKLLSESLLYNCSVRPAIENMAELMAASDICIGAAGVSSLERICLRLPSIVVPVAENQRIFSDALEATGLCVVLRSPDVADVRFTVKMYANRIYDGMSRLQHLAESADDHAPLVDGNGAERIAGAIVERWQ